MDLVPKINWPIGLNVWRLYTGSDATVCSEPAADWQQRIDSTKQKLRHQNSSNKEQTKSVDNCSGDVKATDQPDSKRPRVEHDPAMPSFRVTCYRTGKGHAFQSPQAASSFGGVVQDYFLWNVKMKNYDIEVILNIEEKNVSVMLALTKESMHRRNLTKFGPTALRPTIAYGMLRFVSLNVIL